MILKEWMHRTGKTLTKMSEDIGVSRIHICKICNGSRRAGAKLALMIEDYTKGSVSRDEAMYPEKYPQFKHYRELYKRKPIC